MPDWIIVPEISGILADGAFHGVAIGDDDRAFGFPSGWSNREIPDHVADSFHI
jgi:hypothetical protein